MWLKAQQTESKPSDLKIINEILNTTIRKER